MAGDLFGLSAADRDVLLRMIARERSNYSANVRNLAPVPREKNIWKPSDPIVWLWLREPLYPQSDLSPYNDVPWQATACEMTWNNDTKQWDSVFPETEVTVYATTNIYAMVDMVIPCQKRGDGYEPIASAPPDTCYFEARNASSFAADGDLTTLSSPSTGYGFEEASGVTTDKSGFLKWSHTYRRFAYPASYYTTAIEYENATSPSTDGTFTVNYTGLYEIDLQVWGEIRTFYSGGGTNPRNKAISRTTGAASAGTAHTHSYNEWNVFDGSDPAPAFQAAVWVKPDGGTYEDYGGLAMPVEHFPFASTSGVLRRNWNYKARKSCILTEGDRVGIQVLSEQLYACQMSLFGGTLVFRPMMPGVCTDAGA